ncbi:GNAT family N-acetyltransferase [Psychrobacillus lasiicapitis]|uniref:GNAT family N-acetyltransferase n=1 Tax=Psychrobacillus lasiicapitis TaxID=1636719 RepID=A0A544T4U7_9BACI|nr:GNAT family N-acetyltransferase [Psychrobacillus lasiicapitis]TQR12449.1 GNAT family N-acetyltransferase [Psychrobacillus lasiicapitis]GGA38190.1 N-acetyltransferase [Psychrobacillus lasiicapitis]
MDLSVLEQAEIQTLKSRLSAIQAIDGNPMGVHQLVKGQTSAFAAKNIPGLTFNTVRGLSENDIPYLEDIITFYKKNAINFRFEITPMNSSELLFRALTDKGYYHSGFHASFIGECVENRGQIYQPDIEVCHLNQDDFDLFASIYVNGFGLPSCIQNGIKQNNEVLFDVPGWQFYVAYVKGMPAGVAVLFVQDKMATLAAAATLPEYQGRGVQSTLIQKRIQVAFEKGAKYITSEAAFGSASHRNMEGAGLKLAYTKALWSKF